MSNPNTKAIIPALRDVSRKEYLKKRERQQLSLLEEEVKDEEYLFGNEHLTSNEILENKYKQEILSIAKKRSKTSLAQNYSIPQPDLIESADLQSQELKKLEKERYRTGDGLENDDVEKQWQETQLSKVKTKRENETKEEKEYNLILENPIFDIPESLDIESESLNIDDLGDISLQKQRKTLPIFEYKQSLIDAINDYQILIVVGETGSGKTTQITQYILEANINQGKIIGCTQPRRVAAMSVANRVAKEMNVKLGNEVGYNIRFEDRTSEKTVIKYLTDGMLLREFLISSDLEQYSVIIIDEAHERSLHTDILFGLVKDVIQTRPDLRLIISSATLDAEKFRNFFDDAPLFIIPGRRFPVDIFYTKAPESDYIAAVILTVLQIHITQKLPGDILVFLTGQEEIEVCQEFLIQKKSELGNTIARLEIVPIYSSLPTDLQAKIFEKTPENARKVVLATNIAETSLTIDGIIYVIDPGFCKQNSFAPRNGMESLVVVPISRASAMQRAGRAGRVAPGKCFRLYTANAYEKELDDNTTPEIQRTNLSNTVLVLKSLGISDLIHFDFIDPPSSEALIRALEELYALGALNEKGELTKIGRRMADFPADPQLSKMLIASSQFNCSDEILSICAMLEVSNAVFYRPKDQRDRCEIAHRSFRQANGDHLTFLRIYNDWVDSGYSSKWCADNYIQYRSMNRARAIRDQLVSIMELAQMDIISSDKSNSGFDEIAILKSITSGFFYHTAVLTSSGYQTLKHKQSVSIHPSSCLFESKGLSPKWIIYHELVFTTKEYMRHAIRIEPEWLEEIAPHYYSKKDIDKCIQEKRKMPKKR